MARQRPNIERQDVIRDRARIMRSQMPLAESILWQRLRGDQLGTRFRRQHRVGGFIVDFAAPALKLAIELDGNQHSERLEYDLARTEVIESHGYRVMRFENPEVFDSLDSVVEAIYNAVVDRRSKNPSPSVPLP